MSEFILNTQGNTALDAFAAGYVEAMFFTNGDTGDENENSLNDLGVERLSKKALARIKAECAAFQDTHAALLAEACKGDYDAAQAGRDFWFTRQGHGVGYWDREALPDTLRGKLSEAARAAGESTVFTQRGWIHIDN